MQSEELRDGARDLARRSVETAKLLLAHAASSVQPARGGRKAHRLEVERAAGADSP